MVASPLPGRGGLCSLAHRYCAYEASSQCRVGQRLCPLRRCGDTAPARFRHQLFLSPNYFGDLIRQATGDTAIAFIRNHVMQRATRLLHAGKTITETADLLGFEYPQHFTRQFKKHFGVTPTEYVRRI